MIEFQLFHFTEPKLLSYSPLSASPDNTQVLARIRNSILQIGLFTKVMWSHWHDIVRINLYVKYVKFKTSFTYGT